MTKNLLSLNDGGDEGFISQQNIRNGLTPLMKSKVGREGEKKRVHSTNSTPSEIQTL